MEVILRRLLCPTRTMRTIQSNHDCLEQSRLLVLEPNNGPENCKPTHWYIRPPIDNSQVFFSQPHFFHFETKYLDFRRRRQSSGVLHTLYLSSDSTSLHDQVASCPSGPSGIIILARHYSKSSIWRGRLDLIRWFFLTGSARLPKLPSLCGGTQHRSFLNLNLTTKSRVLPSHLGGSGLVSPDICLLLFFPSDVLFYFFIVPSNSLLPLIISSNTYIACLPSSSRPLLQSKTTDILLHRNDHFIPSSSDTCIQSHPSIPPAFSLIFNPSPSLGACNLPRRADAG